MSRGSNIIRYRCEGSRHKVFRLCWAGASVTVQLLHTWDTGWHFLQGAWRGLQIHPGPTADKANITQGQWITQRFLNVLERLISESSKLKEALLLCECATVKFVKCGSPNFLNFTPLLFQWLIYTVVTQVLRHEELLVRSVYITRIGVFFLKKKENSQLNITTKIPTETLGLAKKQGSSACVLPFYTLNMRSVRPVSTIICKVIWISRCQRFTGDCSSVLLPTLSF